MNTKINYSFDSIEDKVKFIIDFFTQQTPNNQQKMENPVFLKQFTDFINENLTLIFKTIDMFSEKSHSYNAIDFLIFKCDININNPLLDYFQLILSNKSYQYMLKLIQTKEEYNFLHNNLTEKTTNKIIYKI